MQVMGSFPLVYPKLLRDKFIFVRDEFPDVSRRIDQKRCGNVSQFLLFATFGYDKYVIADNVLKFTDGFVLFADSDRFPFVVIVST